MDNLNLKGSTFLYTLYRPLLFNMIINSTFIHYIKSDKFTQLRYQTTKFTVPKHLFQFADDARRYYNWRRAGKSNFVKRFTLWRSRSKMSIMLEK